MPVWSWVAGGVGVVSVTFVAGVMAFNGLGGSSKDPVAVSTPIVSESASPEEFAEAATIAETGGAVYLVDESDFTSPAGWSIKERAEWTKETVKEDMTNCRNSALQLTFTTYQAVLEPTAEIEDEATTL